MRMLPKLHQEAQPGEGTHSQQAREELGIQGASQAQEGDIRPRIEAL